MNLGPEGETYEKEIFRSQLIERVQDNSLDQGSKSRQKSCTIRTTKTLSCTFFSCYSTIFKTFSMSQTVCGKITCLAK